MRRALLIAILVAGALHGQPRAWEDSITLPTYPEAPPDTSPMLDALSESRAWYPYTTRNPLSKSPSPEAWRRINIENEYLACSFLPDVGGRLYTCIDKLSGHPMFYGNPVIKKGTGYTRNAFAAFGIETSFAFAHSRDNVSPADFAFSQDKDSAAVWLSTTDRVTGLRWVVQYVLRTGRAVLEQNVTLSNPTSVRQPYYWWNNAEIAVEPGTRFVVPAHVMSTHGGTALEAWPVSGGVDRSVVANIRDQLGLFAYQSREPFFAVYHAASKTATVHVADPAVVKGKKIWAWGSKDTTGEAALVDDRSRLIEIQAGLFQDQETFEFLPPHSGRSFTEYWVPARALGGITRATADAILHWERAGNTILVELNVTRRFEKAHLRVTTGDVVALDETADLQPGAVFTKKIDNAAPGRLYRLELRDSAGKVLLAHSEAPYDAISAEAVKLGPQPAAAEPPDTFELNGRLQKQEDYWRASLVKSPDNVQAKKSLGRLLVIRHSFAAAVAMLDQTAAALPHDAEVHYYLAVAQAALGRDGAGEQNFAAAIQDPVLGVAARLELAEAHGRTAQAKRAVAETGELAKNAPGLFEAAEARMIWLRVSGQKDAARAELERWRAVAPWNSLLRVEAVRQGAKDDEVWTHLGADPERVLDVADEYLATGAWPDAVNVLTRKYDPVPPNQKEPGKVLPQENPLVAYYAANARVKAGESPEPDRKRAAGLPVVYVFPHRASSFLPLYSAVAANRDDAVAHWLLGLFELDSGMTDPAIGEWTAATAQAQRLPLVRPLLAEVLRQLKHNEAAANAVIRETVKTDPAAAQKAIEQALRKSPPAPSAKPAGGTEKSLPPAVGTHEIAALALVRASQGQLEAALSLFTGTNFPDEHEPDDVRYAYIELQLLRLRAMAAAHQCEAVFKGLDTIGDEDKSLPFTLYGFEQFMKRARFQYYLAGAESACGDQKAARRRLAKVARLSEPVESEDFAFPALAAAIVDERAGRAQEEAALKTVAAALAKTPTDRQGILLFSQALLLRALGEGDKAAAAFGAGAKAPNVGHSQYLNLLQ